LAQQNIWVYTTKRQADFPYNNQQFNHGKLWCSTPQSGCTPEGFGWASLTYASWKVELEAIDLKACHQFLF